MDIWKHYSSIRHWDYDSDHEKRKVFQPISRAISLEKSRRMTYVFVWLKGTTKFDGCCLIVLEIELLFQSIAPFFNKPIWRMQSQFWCIQDKIDNLGRQQNQLAAEAAQLQSSFSLKQMQEIFGQKLSNIFQMGKNKYVYIYIHTYIYIFIFICLWEHGNDMERYGVLSYPR